MPAMMISGAVFFTSLSLREKAPLPIARFRGKIDLVWSIRQKKTEKNFFDSVRRNFRAASCRIEKKRRSQLAEMPLSPGRGNPFFGPSGALHDLRSARRDRNPARLDAAFYAVRALTPPRRILPGDLCGRSFARSGFVITDETW